ncbi:TPA: flagellar hook-length control protein FliK [Citrobacter sedlakii]|nr:flagellar hook-length control protein FliK [Citrobacter sedlakii]HCA7081584.1 flagellar hook-length control protein FliK [Citrobacter sedlakii]HCA7134846.1 flagellar hook-length control protein FliK [Citrobacter sedlakii]HCA7138161.1 flagellar hook-length control protein FliK [Citrobacter sedlakii]HCA7180814.1 flagellar hook-length control protein FliK [Citrobacter sedlakii]
MNPLLQAVNKALTDTASAHDTLPAPAVAAENSDIAALPKAAFEDVAERLKSTKAQHQQSAEAKRTDDNDPAAMQALMAIFLQPAVIKPAPGGEIAPDGSLLQNVVEHSGGKPLAALRQLTDALAQTPSVTLPTKQDVARLSSLPSELQGLVATLNAQSAPQEPVTPMQQAKLATFTAQDLRAIAPEPPAKSTSQKIAARIEQAAHSEPLHPHTVKKSGIGNLRETASAQNLLNEAAQRNQPVEMMNVKTVSAAHSVQPAVMSEDELGEKLTALLKDRIQFQLGQQQQTSTIRLDPPSLGKMDIAIHLDAGKLTVHINASQSDVSRCLQQFSENLRQHLTAQNFMEVNVQVSSDGQSQQHHKQQSGHQQDEVISAISLADEPQYQQQESILIKV